MVGNDIVCQYHQSEKYTTIFNRDTGFFVRKEDIGEKEPFWSEDGPELLDLSITSYCEKECAFCYRQAGRHGKHMQFADVKMVIEEAKQSGVLQIALGGGNPNQHPDFILILRLIREAGIVPSYTTNGEGLNESILTATAKYCGAMAISLYEPYDESYYSSLIDRIKSYGIKVNLHVILRNDLIERIINWLRTPPVFLRNVNAIIFLNYKHISVEEHDLSIKSSVVWKEFFGAVMSSNGLKIGFDSCSVPGILMHMKNVRPELIEPCEAGRFSAFISEELKMYPCSFMCGTEMYADLSCNNLFDIWKNSVTFSKMREKMLNNSCGSCPHVSLCHGGCHFLPSINNCY